MAPDFEVTETGTHKKLTEQDIELERLRAIEQAAIALRDDMILRAEIGTHDGDHSVQAGNSVWYNFCKALGED